MRWTCASVVASPVLESVGNQIGLTWTINIELKIFNAKNKIKALFSDTVYRFSLKKSEFSSPRHEKNSFLSLK
jgi:hypothetical protein